MTTSATNEEIQIVRMARAYSGERIAFGATVLSTVAARLAKYLYDDDLVLLGGQSWGCWDCDVTPILEHDEYLSRPTARGQFDWSGIFDFVVADKVRAFMSPVQIDRHGNCNMSVIGDWDRPKVQLIGSQGLPDDVWRLSVVNYHVPDHTPRTLVERVDFVSSFGYGEMRDRLGCTTGRPGLLVTNLGVFGWVPETGLLGVESLHPGVTPERVREATGFEIEIPEAVPTTPPPTSEELAAIRNVIDPWDARAGTGSAAGTRASEIVARTLGAAWS